MIVFFSILALGFLDSEHIFLYVLGGLVAQLIYSGARKHQYTRVFLFYSGFQFIQIFSSLLYARYLGKEPEELYEIPNIQWVIGLTMIQLLLMFWITVGLLKKYINTTHLLTFDEQVAGIVLRMNVYRVVMVYAVSSGLFALLMLSFGDNGSIRQLMDVTNNFVYVFCIFLLCSYVIQSPSWNFKRFFATAILIAGFILSFSSFFSSFKIFFICFLLAAVVKLPTMNLKNFVGLGIVMALLTYFMIFWSAVKGDYRAFVSTQKYRSMADNQADALGRQYLWQKFQNFDSKQMDNGMAQFFYRVQYMEFYSLVIKKIPARMDFQEGRELLGTIEFLTTPRILNPDKKILDPSSKVNKFTGRRVTTAKYGTSISIGYFANLYLDFGFYLMTIPLIALAFILYLMLKWIIKSFAANEFIKLSLAYSTVLGLGFFESDIDYYLGTVRNTLVLLFLLRRLPYDKIEKFLFPPIQSKPNLELVENVSSE